MKHLTFLVLLLDNIALAGAALFGRKNRYETEIATSTVSLATGTSTSLIVSGPNPIPSPPSITENSFAISLRGSKWFMVRTIPDCPICEREESTTTITSKITATESEPTITLTSTITSSSVDWAVDCAQKGFTQGTITATVTEAQPTTITVMSTVAVPVERTSIIPVPVGSNVVTHTVTVNTQIILKGECAMQAAKTIDLEQTKAEHDKRRALIDQIRQNFLNKLTLNCTSGSINPETLKQMLKAYHITPNSNGTESGNGSTSNSSESNNGSIPVNQTECLEDLFQASDQSNPYVQSQQLASIYAKHCNLTTTTAKNGYYYKENTQTISTASAQTTELDSRKDVVHYYNGGIVNGNLNTKGIPGLYEYQNFVEMFNNSDIAAQRDQVDHPQGYQGQETQNQQKSYNFYAW